MSIRDENNPGSHGTGVSQEHFLVASVSHFWASRLVAIDSTWTVSYTHLTLPTKA